MEDAQNQLRWKLRNMKDSIGSLGFAWIEMPADIRKDLIEVMNKLDNISRRVEEVE